jgi:tripartite-type tricarboxylate transporter receptor subunit TctC
MHFTRRTFTLGALTAPFASRAQAQAWPSGTIRIVVAYPPGGSTDAMMRLVQPGLQQKLGATIVIENRSGASGSVGTAAVAKSPPDGNTWLSRSTITSREPVCAAELALRH